MAARPDMTSYVEASVRNAYIEWTPGLIRQAELLADSGDLRLAADLCDAVLGDETVQAALDTRTRALLGLPLSFEAGQGRKKRAAAKAIEAEEDWWKQWPEDETSGLLKWGALLNVGLSQTSWENDDDTGRVLGRAKVWHPRWLRQDAVTHEWRLTIDGGQQITIQPGDGKWVLFTPKGSHRPWTNGAWRAVARWWLLKRYAIADWGRYSERHGQGTWVATSPQGAKKEDRKELAADLAQVGKNAAIGLPVGFDLKLVEATANTWQTFKEQIAAADKGITVALTGQNVTNEEGGSYAKAVFLGGVRLELIAADAETFGTTAHDDHLVYWAEFNFGDRRGAPWPEYETDPPEDQKAKADTLVSLGTALSLLKSSSERVDVDTILEDYDIPLLAESELPKKPPAPPAPTPPAPPTPPAEPDGDESDTPPEPEGDETPKPEDDQPPPPPPKKAAKALRTKAKGKSKSGQKYIDSVAEQSHAKGAKALEPDLKDILAEVRNAKSFAGLRKAIVARYKDMTPDALAKVVARSMVLGRLAGRLAVTEES